MKKFIFSIILSFLFAFNLQAQIKIKEIPNYKLNYSDSSFFKISQTRKVESLNGKWKVYLPDNEENKIDAFVPSIFEGNDELVFEKNISISKKDLLNHRFIVSFLGVNYSAEISLNDIILYKNPGGEIPFEVELPRTILKSGNDNVLKVRVKHELDSESTIPSKQSFLQPINNGGIFRDVLLYKIPNVIISNEKYNYKLDKEFKKLTLDTEFEISKEFINGYKKDTTQTYYLNSVLIDPNGKKVSEKQNIKINFENGNDANVSLVHQLKNPVLWQPKYPKFYKVVTSIYTKDRLVDKIIKTKSFYNLTVDDNFIYLNGKKINLKGTCYIQSYNEFGSLLSLEQIKKDIELIKETGFNSVRFSKQMPHPYALYLCNKEGLFSFVDIPINSAPEQLTQKSRFKERASVYLRYLTDSYSKVTDFTGVGLGSGYLSNSEIHADFLKNLASILSGYNNKIVYSSFVGIPKIKIEGLDLYGIELFNKPVSDYNEEIIVAKNVLGNGRLIISEATYSNFNGNSSGYFNKNSFEAQAKYFEDLINFASKRNLKGYFINSFFDYRGNFSAFATGYNDKNILQIGLIDENRVAKRIAYKVVMNKLKNGERITIPMGSKKENFNVFFILSGIIFTILLGILVNSKRKFREDAKRAFFRPYNFYADIRDQRILSGFHSNFLMVILSGSFSLFITSLLYFLRTNFLLQRVIESFGSHWFVKFISYLAWNPVPGSLYIFFIIIFFYFFVSVIIHSASFFVKNKVLFSSIYFMVTWATLPFTILLPLDIVFYKVLTLNAINIYIYIFLIIFMLWIIQRLFKGIYVLFDVRGSNVYFWGLISILFVFGGILLYFQISESTIYYMINAYKQFILM